MKNNVTAKTNPALRKKYTAAVFGGIATVCLAYCFILYFILQKSLVPGAGAIPAGLQTASYLVMPALLACGLYHIYLLKKLLESLTGRFLNSLFALLVICSGVLLCSDVTLLSDIGKEYALLDVTDQWIMLYAFTAFHVLIVILGQAVLQSRSSVRPDESGRNEAVYISVHHIALVSGLLGIAGVFFAMSGAVIPLRFSTGFMAILAALALIPLIFILVYWRLRIKKKAGGAHLDEKQLSDTAFAGLIALLSALPVYILVCALDLLSAIHLPMSFFILLLFFIQLGIFSSVVLLKNR